ncbi:MAG: hypothetical protein JKX81_03330 [Arenicella sp.]|nr:hypothetical protein [Arenicella sp.]
MAFPSVVLVVPVVRKLVNWVIKE